MLKNGGYIMLNLIAEDVYKQALNVLALRGDKAIMLYDGVNVGFADGVRSSGENIIIDKGSDHYIITKTGVTTTKNITDLTKLTDDQCNALRCGDIVIKKTGDQYHSYRVSYKKDDEGMCLTYTDASLVETISYDLTGGHWVYNSTDHTTLTPDA